MRNYIIIRIAISVADVLDDAIVAFVHNILVLLFLSCCFPISPVSTIV